jgi:hypothetical protein
MEVLNLIGFLIGILGIAIAAYQMTQDSKALRRMAELLLLHAVILYRAISHENDLEAEISAQQENLWSEFLDTARTVYSDKGWNTVMVRLEELLHEPTEERN